MLPDGLGRGFALVRALFLSATMAGVAPLFAAETGDAPAAAQQQPSADNPADDNQTAKQNYEPGQSTPPTAQSICDVLAATATSNDLPVDFFTRLIWQESRFKPDVVSTKGAQGIAQFMPMTALSSGLADPFNPREAIAKSGQLLRELHREFGNLGLAAAAYNAGPRRVHDWLGSHRPLPQETRAYVRLVTGHSVDEWAGDQSKPLDVPSAGAVPCHPSLGALLQPRPATSAPKPEQIKPWGVEVVGGPTPAKALARYREWQSRYTAILADREPRIVVRGVVGQMGAARVRVDEETRDGADRLCASLRAAGTYCEVWRN
jgi:hypothetical protein